MPVEVISGVAVERSGTGTPTLVFLHGFACDRSDWDAQVDALSRRFSVITLDLPGHGQSSLIEPPTTEAIARSISEIVTGFGDNGVIFVGHSLGCRIAIEIYRQRPENVRGLVLLDNGEVGHGDPVRTVSLFDEQLRSLGVRGLLAHGFEGMFTSQTESSLRRRVIDRVATIDTEFAEALLRDAVRWGAYDAPLILADVKVPVLLLQSTARDENNRWQALKPGMTTPWTELVSRSVRDVELCIIPDVGHFLQIEAPHPVNEEIARFATRVSDQNREAGERASC